MKPNLIWSNFSTSSWLVRRVIAPGTSLLPHLQIIAHKPNSPSQRFSKKAASEIRSAPTLPTPLPIPEITLYKKKGSPPPPFSHQRIRTFLSSANNKTCLYTSVFFHQISSFHYVNQTFFSLNNDIIITEMWRIMFALSQNFPARHMLTLLYCIKSLREEGPSLFLTKLKR